MKFLFLIVKNLIKYTLLVFVTYIFVMNVSINAGNFVKILVESICLAILLVPPSLISYFGGAIAKNCRYKRTIEINRDIETAFKSARTLLKTMSDINLVDSNSENKTYKLQSEFSKIDIIIKSVDEGKISFEISSIPRVYNVLSDYNKYTLDVKNIIALLKLHLIPEEEQIEDSTDGEDYFEDFKPSILVYYRLIKSWLMYVLTLFILISLFLFAIKVIPEPSTLVFFILLFLYISYIFTNEISKDSCFVKCPACDRPLISDPFNLKEYKLLANCKHCNQNIIKISNPQK